jgi:hypothetical protein
MVQQKAIPVFPLPYTSLISNTGLTVVQRLASAMGIIDLPEVIKLHEEVKGKLSCPMQ